MRRLFLLLLICLLPLQVFAGMANAHLTHSQHTVQAISQGLQSAAMTTDVATTTDSNDQEDAPDDGLAKDLSNHASFGDDAMPAGFLIFAQYSPAFISALHDDAASVPPYLPPAARPPKI